VFLRIIAEKDIDILVAAAAKLSYIPFRIVGNGTDLEKFQQLVSEQKLENVFCYQATDDSALAETIRKL